jgi:hypothetical protein
MAALHKKEQVSTTSLIEVIDKNTRQMNSKRGSLDIESLTSTINKLKEEEKHINISLDASSISDLNQSKNYIPKDVIFSNSPDKYGHKEDGSPSHFESHKGNKIGTMNQFKK